MLKVSIGIPAYNEEANIGQLLESLSSQRLSKVEIDEILVIVSGSDQTAKIVSRHQKKDPRIKVVREKRRSGKSSADNLFFRRAKAEILVLQCADTLPRPECLEKLILPFADSKVGLTAARMLPLNDKESLPGYFSHLWWRLFDKVAREHFRAGELMAFRNFGLLVPKHIGCDEVWLTDEILSRGFQARYVPDALCYNLGPGTIGDIIRLRRRHSCHHLHFGKLGPKVYFPKTMDSGYVFKLFLKEVNWSSLKESLWAVLSLILEAFCRLLAFSDFLFNKKYQIWPSGKTTKRLSREKEANFSKTPLALRRG